MDPNWDNCPYCEAQARSGKKAASAGDRSTVVEAQAAETAGSTRRTVVGDMPAMPLGRETVVLSDADASGTSVIEDAQDTRKIVGVLVTYSWRPGGQLFPVREGKNYIGSDNRSAQHLCGIHIANDHKMSGVHALILCRSGKNEIIDRESSNGTFLDGEMLSSNQSYELKNNAEIKTGSTTWYFVKIQPSEIL